MCTPGPANTNLNVRASQGRTPWKNPTCPPKMTPETQAGWRPEGTRDATGRNSQITPPFHGETTALHAPHRPNNHNHHHNTDTPTHGGQRERCEDGARGGHVRHREKPRILCQPRPRPFTRSRPFRPTPCGCVARANVYIVGGQGSGTRGDRQSYPRPAIVTALHATPVHPRPLGSRPRSGKDSTPLCGAMPMGGGQGGDRARGAGGAFVPVWRSFSPPAHPATLHPRRSARPCIGM